MNKYKEHAKEIAINFYRSVYADGHDVKVVLRMYQDRTHDYLRYSGCVSVPLDRSSYCDVICLRGRSCNESEEWHYDAKRDVYTHDELSNHDGWRFDEQRLCFVHDDEEEYKKQRELEHIMTQEEWIEWEISGSPDSITVNDEYQEVVNCVASILENGLPQGCKNEN